MEQRYFIGITLPKDLSQTIAITQQELFMPHKILTPLAPHITLLEPKLLQTIPLDMLIPQVRKAAETILPIQVTLTDIDCFNKHVLYIAAQGSKLHTLREQLLDLLLTTPANNRPFRPHVTLAQTKPNQILTDTLIMSYRDKIEPLLPISFTISRLVYFQWVHPRTYALYEI